MCIMCDGASLDEARFSIHGIIERFGWFIQYVEADPLSRTWAYTIGLSAGFEHPELVIPSVTPEAAGRILNGIGEMVRRGRRFAAGDEIEDRGGRVLRLSEVHPVHFERNVFASWVDYYGCLGPPYPEERALEVVPAGRKAMLAGPWAPIG